MIIDTNRNVTPYLGAMKGKVSAVIRYISPLGTGTEKTVHAAEAHAIAAAGMRLMIVCEGYGDVTHGSLNSAAGARDELVCVTYAKNIGMPLSGVTLAFAVDVDLDSAQIRAYVLPYFSAIRQRLPKGIKVMPYGSGNVCAAVIAAGLGDYGWVSGSTGWSGSHAYIASRKWQLRQTAMEQKPFGFDCDQNELNSDYGPLGDFVPFSASPALAPLAPLVFAPEAQQAAKTSSLWDKIKGAAASIGV